MSKRIFVGIPLSEKVSRACIRIRTTLEDRSSIRWIEPNNLHITLFFIGKVEDDALAKLNESLSRIGSVTKPFHLRLQQYCYFPDRRPRMIWAQFEPCEDFNTLAKSIDDAAAHLRANEEKKDPLPHATLARMKYLAPEHRTKLPSAPPLEQKVESFNLYESFLSSEGSRYEVIAPFPLHAAVSEI